MERKITKLEHAHVQVDVVVDEKSWTEAKAKAFKKLAANVEVKGFRKGKAPENLVKSKVDQVKVMDEAINALLPEIYKDIIEVDGVKPYARPQVDVTKISDKELEVKFVIVTAPEIKLGNYKGLKIGKETVEVTAEDVEKAIEDTLSQNATLVVKDGEALKGDTVVIDFVGTIDGVAFDGGSAQNHELELGSGQFIPGFEDQLIGHKAGEHVDVNVTFPENYTPELKGKAALFGCDIHEVKEKKLPALDDEFVKEQKIKDVETVEAFKGYKESQLKTNKENAAHRAYIEKVIETVANGSEIDIPNEIIDNQVETRKEDLTKRMAQSGLTLEQYLQILGQKEEDFIAKLKEDATKDVKSVLVLDEIAKAEKIEISEADVDFELAKLAEQYNMKLEDVKKAIAPQLGEFTNNIKMQRVETVLYNENN